MKEEIKLCETCAKKCPWWIGIIKRGWMPKTITIDLLRTCPCNMCLVKAACTGSCHIMSKHFEHHDRNLSNFFIDLYNEK